MLEAPFIVLLKSTFLSIYCLGTPPNIIALSSSVISVVETVAEVETKSASPIDVWYRISKLDVLSKLTISS